jgi:hypothetical protein
MYTPAETRGRFHLQIVQNRCNNFAEGGGSIFLISTVDFKTTMSDNSTHMYCSYLFLVLFYLLMYSVSMESNDRLVLINNITGFQFNRLLAEYPETLSCPCSNTALAYKKFVINEVEMSPICSSAFVNLSWIRSLHIPTASLYVPIDFRASAEAQVS